MRQNPMRNIIYIYYKWLKHIFIYYFFKLLLVVCVAKIDVNVSFWAKHLNIKRKCFNQHNLVKDFKILEQLWRDFFFLFTVTCNKKIIICFILGISSSPYYSLILQQTLWLLVVVVFTINSYVKMMREGNITGTKLTVLERRYKPLTVKESEFPRQLAFLR